MGPEEWLVRSPTHLYPSACSVHRYLLTCLTPHSSIFKMCTVVGTKRVLSTLEEVGLPSSAPDIIHPDLTNTIGEASGQSNSTCTTIVMTILCMFCVIQSPLHYVPVSLNCNCLHATVASLLSHKSSHTVPQTLLLQTSTRPLVAVPP